jgi:hypothetical protein
VAGGLGGLGWVVGPEQRQAWQERARGTQPFAIGLGEERGALVETVKQHTTPLARILWEDRPSTRLSSRWPALLPLLTGRAFIGGLDPDAGIEHTAMGLGDQTLAGRPLREWTDAELHNYCARYNVGWVACWSAGARERFAAWPEAQPVAQLRDEGEGLLFVLNRRFSFAQVGSAKLIRADSGHLILGDVVPQNGQVVLCFHFQAGLRVSPSRVTVERELDPIDPIPRVRLRLTEPAARVMLTWEKR